MAKYVDVVELLGVVDLWKYSNKMELSFDIKCWVEKE